MESKTQIELEKAKALFYQWRLIEAYNILRRYYDRLPFKPEPEHADYIGIFTRTLLELGKDYELKFYTAELEKLYAKSKNPQVGFQLAVVYCVGPDSNLKNAKQLLDSLVRNPEAKAYHPKAKLYLAVCYDSLDKDVAACRQIIDSIESSDDPVIEPLINIWKAKILRDEGKYGEAQIILNQVFESTTRASDWYSHFSAQVIQAGLYVRAAQMDRAGKLIVEIKKQFEGKNFKTIRIQISVLEELIKENQSMGVIALHKGLKENRLTYEEKTIGLQKQSATEKLFLGLARKKVLDKTLIVKNIYNRQYAGEEDDKLVYYHVHALRKCLQKIGLPTEAIIHDDGGYRLIPDVHIIEGEL